VSAGQFPRTRVIRSPALFVAYIQQVGVGCEASGLACDSVEQRRLSLRIGSRAATVPYPVRDLALSTFSNLP